MGAEKERWRNPVRLPQVKKVIYATGKGEDKVTATLPISDAVMHVIRDLGDYSRTGDMQSLSNVRKGIRAISTHYGRTAVADSLYAITLRLQREMMDDGDEEDDDDPQ